MHYGIRSQLRHRWARQSEEIQDGRIASNFKIPAREKTGLHHHCGRYRMSFGGSATQAPGRRTSLGLGRNGSFSGTAPETSLCVFHCQRWRGQAHRPPSSSMLANDELDSSFFSATVQATEEAIVNALVAPIP